MSQGENLSFQKRKVDTQKRLALAIAEYGLDCGVDYFPFNKKTEKVRWIQCPEVHRDLFWCFSRNEVMCFTYGKIYKSSYDTSLASIEVIIDQLKNKKVAIFDV